MHFECFNMTILIFQYILIFYSPFVECHLPSYVSTPSDKVEKSCMMAESCLHDTIPVCGVMGEKKRTFLDLCDLIEYACDTNMVYKHIEDTEGCPLNTEPRLGK